MKTFDKVWLIAAAVFATSVLPLGGTVDVRAAYEDEVMALDPLGYWRLDEEAGAPDAESLGSGDALAEYHVDTDLGVPGLISDASNTAAQILGDLGGDDTGVHIPDFDGLNTGGPWTEKSIVLWFKADDVEAFDTQMLFEEGGATRGLNLYVREGEVYVGAWNRASDGPGSPWESGMDDPAGGNLYLHTPIASGETYQVAMVMDGDSVGTDGTLTGYLNGQPFDEKTGVGTLYNHGDDTAIGHTHQNSYIDDGQSGGGNTHYFSGVIDEVALFNSVLDASTIQSLYVAGGGAGGGAAALQAGDANMDYEFNQLDLVQVQIAAKYLTGQAATWGDGDWDAAPGGEPGNPPTGNGMFDQLDIIAALGAGTYLQGPYNAINKGGQPNDGQTSIIYNPSTGELGVDAPAGVELTSVNIDSAAGVFTGDPAQNLGGSFDNDADNNIFKATFGSSFGSLSFGNVAQTGLSEDFVASDLTVVGSLNGGGDLGAVDLIYVPEPSALVLLALGLVGILLTRLRS